MKSAVDSPGPLTPDAPADQIRSFILPHRSYRRLPVRGFRSRIASTLVVILIEVAAIFLVTPMAGAASRFVLRALNGSGMPAEAVPDAYLGFTLHPVLSGMAPAAYQSLALCLVLAIVAIIVLSLLRPALPLRYFLISNLVMVIASAAYLIVVGHPGYDQWQFSRLYLTTVVTVWLVLPVVVGLSCMLFPFTTLETAFIILIALVYDVLLSTGRYAIFLWLLAKTGPLLMPNLYLFFGPLLDFALVVGLFSIALVRLSAKLVRHTEDWAWL